MDAKGHRRFAGSSPEFLVSKLRQRLENWVYFRNQRVKGYAGIYIVLGFDVMEKLDILLFSDLVNFEIKIIPENSRIDF